MSAKTAADIDELLNKVIDWPADKRLSLAHALLTTVEKELPPTMREKKGSLRNLIGILDDGTPGPSDAEVERLLDERRMGKLHG